MKNKEQPLVQRLGTLKNGNPPFDLSTLPRCAAKSKQTGKRCGQAAMRGKNVCYYHGVKSPGPPQNNQNSLKHGFYKADAIFERKLISHLLRDARQTLEKFR